MTMTPIREVKDILDREALEGRKIAHGISSPVVICIDGVYVLAAYLFLYTPAQLRDKMIGRPSKWIIADLKTGHVLHRYDCFNVDFSDAPADRLYSIVPEADRNVSDEYYHHTDELIDKVRADLLAGRGFDVDTHTEYVRLINANWPREYRRFLTDLASGTFYHRHQESLGDADEATTYSEKTENGTELSDASTPSGVKANVSGDDLTSKSISVIDSSQEDVVAVLKNSIDDVCKLFDERIVGDKYEQEMFDHAHSELVDFQNGSVDKRIDDIAIDLIRLIDSTRKHIRTFESVEPNADNYRRVLGILSGAAEDLQDILYGYDVENYIVPKGPIDHSRQKVIRIVPTANKAADGKIAARVDEGYERDGEVIRPERVMEYRYDKSFAAKQTDISAQDGDK